MLFFMIDMYLVYLCTGYLARREIESDDYKSKIAELMALNPSTPTSFNTTRCSDNSSPRFINSFSPAPVAAALPPGAAMGLGHLVGPPGGGTTSGGHEMLAKSSLNPHACDYQPKVTQ